MHLRLVELPMAYFQVLLSGSGISYAFEGEADAVVGFFTTRVVRAQTLADAQHLAKQLVLTEWRAGGAYAVCNRGGVPSLVVEESFRIGFLRGVFGRSRKGYAFYTQD